jgi:hypothetical protein
VRSRIESWEADLKRQRNQRLVSVGWVAQVSEGIEAGNFHPIRHFPTMLSHSAINLNYQDLTIVLGIAENTTTVKPAV